MAAHIAVARDVVEVVILVVLVVKQIVIMAVWQVVAGDV